ncbi:Gfo/Idh/MocA family protein [Cohnella sp. JJ-181]|uniref:Gfo/Idh/MocA family protein n=1 Tax=Cohnella rhizoplanae TaxID=2974897 RepID=UPI0022FF7C61|nr:Gfo/Idh/MocA family oxidoreductase [Cohnella sp. JJ-181]CAI6066363.1 Inositol 2-dehydrogenase/D-chiro-inositol 3-dehydrogenase [Cohnella sp. JJ-181]
MAGFSIDRPAGESVEALAAPGARQTRRLGVVGLGGMALAHIEGLRKLEGISISAICDVQQSALDQAGERFGIPAEHLHTDYGRLIADDAVDAVVSATPNALHAEVMRLCLLAGKPFLSEKPFTRTYEEAEELNALYATHPVPAMIGFSYRYTPAFRLAKRMLDEGRIGAVRSFSIQYLQGWGAAVYKTPFVWRFDRNVTGTGTLGDLGAHMVDLAHYLFGSFEELSARLQTLIPERIDPRTGEARAVEVDDFASFQSLMANGAAGLFQTTRNAVGSGNQLEASIFGDEGTLMASTERPEEVVWIRVDAETGELVRETRRSPQRERLTQWEDFAAMLNGEPGPGLPDFGAGYENQRVLEAIVRSHEEKRTISLR